MTTEHQNFTFRLARASDAQHIAVMSRDLIEAGMGWSWGVARVERALAHRDTLTVVACNRNRPAGSIAGFAIMQFGDEHAHLALFAVRPVYQRRGLGRRMIQWLVESAYAAGIAAIHLEVRGSNQAARCFYRALGFTETTYVPGYYQGREMAVRMLRELRKAGVTTLTWRLPAPPSD